MKDTSVILLAGGLGTRFGASTPKQFVGLKGKPIAQYSFELFLSHPKVREIVVVCEENFRSLFQKKELPIIFANPGERRQDSVFNGFAACNPLCQYVCIHDSARPFVSYDLLDRLMLAAKQSGAAAPGVPVKCTVKESLSDDFVSRTPDRSTLFEIQTPQIIRRGLLQKGFDHANDHDLTVTDDVSLVELLREPVKIVAGGESNIKITTPQDFALAEMLLK